MSPYRSAPAADDTSADPALAVPHEEWLTAGMLALVGALRVLVALGSGETFGTEVTIAALVGCSGVVLLGQLARRTACARRL